MTTVHVNTKLRIIRTLRAYSKFNDEVRCGTPMLFASNSYVYTYMF
jgi:hypothetical protein